MEKDLSVPASPVRVRVAALAVTGRGILLVRHKKGERENLLLPGGGVEPGESDHEALIRELREETGLAAEPGRLLFETETVFPNKTRAVRQKVYLCTVTGDFKPSVDPVVAGVEWFSRERFKTVRLLPNLRDRILEAWGRDFKTEYARFEVPWED